MNFDKSKVLLKKINAIHDSVAEVGGSFSSLERDLILEYIRNLYECIRQDKTDETPAPLPDLRVRTEPQPTAQPKSVPAPPVAPSKPEPTYISNGVAATTSSNGHHPEPMPEVQVAPIVIDMNPEMEELFAESQLTDLSQRFANAPIADISKAMGINERILTINELFKGDQQQFKITADTLNEFTTFAEAKAYLSKGPAAKFDWTNNKRKKKAAVFIKLVRRRYM